MVKQLHYSELHLKRIEIYLSKLYIGKYSEVNDVIKYTLKTPRMLIVLSAGAILNILRMQVAVSSRNKLNAQHLDQYPLL